MKKKKRFNTYIFEISVDNNIIDIDTSNINDIDTYLMKNYDIK